MKIALSFMLLILGCLSAQAEIVDRVQEIKKRFESIDFRIVSQDKQGILLVGEPNWRGVEAEIQISLINSDLSNVKIKSYDFSTSIVAAPFAILRFFHPKFTSENFDDLEYLAAFLYTKKITNEVYFSTGKDTWLYKKLPKYGYAGAEYEYSISKLPDPKLVVKKMVGLKRFKISDGFFLYLTEKRYREIFSRKPAK